MASKIPGPGPQPPAGGNHNDDGDYLEDVEDQVWDLIDEANDMPHGPTQVALGEEAVRLADQAGDATLGFAARDELISFAQFSGMPEVSLVAFSWCLAMCDKEPERFDDEDLLWKYKWVIAGLPSFPAISRQQIDDSIADMTRRLERNGHGLKSVYKLRFRVALSMGDRDEAADWYRQWQDAPPDDNQDCAACNLDDVVDWHIENGQDEDALKRAKPLTSGRMGCAEVPHATYASLLRSTLRLGRHDEGRRFHEEGLRLIGNNGGEFMREIGLHVEWLALTGQFARALPLLEKHLRWPFVSGYPDDRFTFFLCAHTLLDRMLRVGAHVPQHLRMPAEFPLHNPENVYDPAAVRDWFGQRAEQMAAEFNRRNGNDWFTQRIRQLAEMEQFAVDLDAAGD